MCLVDVDISPKLHDSGDFRLVVAPLPTARRRGPGLSVAVAVSRAATKAAAAPVVASLGRGGVAACLRPG